MKQYTTKLFVTALTLVLAIPAFAAQNPGTYTSTDLGGSLLIGRSSTSREFPNSGLPHLAHSASWDGVALGNQWWFKCAKQTVATPPNLTFYNVGTGTGVIKYHQEFFGGTFHFEPGPWGSGDGTLGTTIVDIDVTVVNFVVQGSRANIFSDGQFTGGCAIRYSIGNGTGVGETSDPPNMTKPATYPDFLDVNCNPTRQYGTWGDITQIQMLIDCATPTKTSTWGQVKQIYR